MRPLLLLVVVLGACDKPGTAVDFRLKKVEGGKSVATWSGDSLNDATLKERFASMSPYQRVRLQTLEQKKDYVDGVVRFELLAQEAVRRGLANDPEVVESTKKVMVQRLMQKEMEDRAFPISDAQISEYYEKHKSDFVKPAMVRLSHVFFTKEHRAEAEATLKEAQALQPLDYTAFAKLARERSEEPRTKPIEGDLRFLSDEELSAQYGPELVEAQKELTSVGQVLPRLVETKAGLHVVRLAARQQALNLGPEQVRVQLQSTLLNEAKQEHYRNFLEQLKKNAAYQLDENALGALEVDVKAPAVEQKGPVPGFAPPPEQKRQIQ